MKPPSYSPGHLTHAEHWFRILAETSPAAIFVYRDTILFANRAAVELTGYDEPGRTIDVAADGNGFFYQVRQVREALAQGRRALSRPAARPRDSLDIMGLLTRWERACEESDPSRC